LKTTNVSLTRDKSWSATWHNRDLPRGSTFFK